MSDLFAGAIVPGLLLVALYLALSDRYGRAETGKLPGGRRRAPASAGLLEALLAPVLLIVAVLGSILVRRRDADGGGVASARSAPSLLAARKARLCADC